MNVLSLFDGMSCGRIALERAGIPVTSYYAAEIDKWAIKIAKKNYPDTIHLGDVRDVHDFLLPEIDLLIGGSPCQGFSFIGKMLNFEDPRSKLFFEFVRLKEELKPKWFLLENVKMKKESQDIISRYLGVEPIEINSALVSAQNRKRLYWTNIPFGDLPEDKGLVLKDILESNGTGVVKNRRFYQERNEKSMCLDANYYKGADNHGQRTLVEYILSEKEIQQSTLIEEGVKCYRMLTPVECERLQTVPDNYTEGVSNTQRYKMLGNGWTVDVITHIFKGLL